MLQGDGIDVYDFLMDVDETNPKLYSTGKKFWVGVIEGLFPSPPVPRNKTRCFTCADVYLYRHAEVFAMNCGMNGEHHKVFYKIPLNERQFIVE